MKSHLYTAVIALFAAFGCAGPLDPAGIEDIAENGSGIQHECDSFLLHNDMWNCGACGTVCGLTDSDTCFEGRCSCGENPYGYGPDYCRPGSDCRRGMCIAVDPAGDICEFDEECPEKFGCIEGHCSDLGCLPEQGLLACDGEDNDCDGCIDGVLDENGICVHKASWKFDIVFLIDVSNSMSGYEIAAVKEAVHGFSTQYAGDENFRFGTVLLPSYEVDGRPGLYTDLTDFNEFDRRLSAINAQTMEGKEPQYDAVYELATGELPLSWRDDATRIIIGLTDERGQSHRPEFGLSEVSEQGMCDSLVRGEMLAFITDTDSYLSFNECAVLRTLTPNAETLKERIAEVMVDPCTYALTYGHY